MADQQRPSGSEPVTNIVIVGRTGNGKSATGNTLLGHKGFKSTRQAGGVTMESKMIKTAIQGGPIINVIDTPGLFDSTVSNDYLSKEIVTCLSMAQEGLHAVLFVLSVKGRISEEEEKTLNVLQRIFEAQILEYFIVVFTGGDELEEDGLTLEEYLTGCPEFLTKVLRLCNERKVLFDNRTTDKDKKAKQVKQLLDLIEDVKKKTGGRPYTDKMHRRIKEENDKLREKERYIESQKLSKENEEAMKKRSKMESMETMKLFEQMFARMLQENKEAHEREMSLLRESIQRGQQRRECNIL